MLQRPASDISLHLTDRESANLKRLVDYSSLQSLPEIWPVAQQQFGETIALKNPHVKPEVTISYIQMAQQIQQFAAGLQALGVQPDLSSTRDATSRCPVCRQQPSLDDCRPRDYDRRGS